MSNQHTSLDTDVKYLRDLEHFARFMNFIYQLREETIEELHNADAQKITQISGRILSYDQILEIVQYESLIDKHRNNVL
jgi:hypothetical protein